MGLAFWETWDFGIRWLRSLSPALRPSLVILFFMHVRYSSKLTKLTISAGFFWLMIMITLSLSDYLTRTFLPR